MDVTNFTRPAQWLLDYFGVGSGKVHVTHKTALENAPIWYGINKISGNVGSLPLNVMRSLRPGSEKATDHPAYGLLKMRPNRFQSPFVFKQTLTHHAIMWGNGRAYIRRVNGVPVELLPLMPDRTMTGMVDGEKWHCTMPAKNSAVLTDQDLMTDMEAHPDKTLMLPDSDVIHVQGFGNGITGLSLFEVARYSLEISLGADRRASKQMVKGFAGKVMLEAPENSPRFRQQKDIAEFMEDFKAKHGVDGSAEEVGMLIGGIKANVLQMSNRDAEFIEQRKFQRQEAALWLMLESILGDDESVSYGSEEQKQLAYLKNCLSNWLVRWEEECAYKLLRYKEFMSGDYFLKFNPAALLRPDFPTTVDTLCKGITHRLWNPNEARDRIDLNPYEGGDAYENPAITPGIHQEPDESGAMEARIQHMLAIEQKRVSGFLSRNDSIDHIDKWYEKWVDKLGAVVEEFGGDWTTAQAHCVRSLNYLKQKPETFDLSGSAEIIIEEIRNVQKV